MKPRPRFPGSGIRVVSLLAAYAILSGCGGKNATAPPPVPPPQWSQCNGPRVSGIHRLLALPQGIYVGSSNGLVRSTDGGATWSSLPVGGYGAGALDIVDVEAYGNALFAASLGDFRRNYRGLYASMNAGDSWYPLLQDQAVGSMAASDTAFYVGCYGAGVLRESANVGTWTPVNDGLPEPSVSLIARRQSVLLAVVAEGSAYALFRSDDAGDHWRAAGAGLPGIGISRLCPVGTRWFLGTYGAGVFRSDDDGDTWTAVDQGLTQPSITDLASAGTTVYAATVGGGVFQSLDGGATWSSLNAGLPSLTVAALAVDGKTLFAAIDGTGVFRYPLP